MPPCTNADLPRLYIYELPDRYRNEGRPSGRGFGVAVNATPPLPASLRLYSAMTFATSSTVYDRAMTYVCRTTDPSMADVFFIPVFTANKGRMSHVPCADNCSKENFFARLNAIRHIDNSSNTSYFDRFRGADHFVVSGQQGCPFALRPVNEMTHFSKRMGLTMHFAVEQHLPSLGRAESWPTPPQYRPLSKYYSLPWASSVHFAASTPWSDLTWRSKHKRSILASGVFSLGLHTLSQRDLRFTLNASCAPRPAHICTILNPAQRLEERDGDRAANANSPNGPLQIAHLYFRSTFCLQPIGDGATRAGILDSLLLGCIPVLFHPAQLQWPFHSGTWLRNATVLYNMTDVTAQSSGFDVVAALESIPPQEIARMQSVIAEHGHRLHYLASSDVMVAATLDAGTFAAPESILGDKRDAFDIVLDVVRARSSQLKRGNKLIGPVHLVVQ